MVVGAAGAPLADMGGHGDRGDGEAYGLPLAAAKATDGVAHQQDLAEVRAAEAGAAKGLSGTELALDGDSAAEVRLSRDDGVVGGDRTMGAAIRSVGHRGRPCEMLASLRGD